MTERLAQRVNQYHGTPLRRFLDRLTQASAPTGSLDKFVADRTRAFRNAAGGNRNDQCESTVTDTFALAYAAGRIAREIGILPANWQIGRAVMRCYRKELHRTPLPPSFHDTLDKISMGPNVVHLGGDEGQIGTFNDTYVFFRIRPRGNELLIRPSAIYAVIPDWDALVRLPSVKSTMVMDKGHMTVKRRLGDGQAQRVFCFKLASIG